MASVNDKIWLPIQLAFRRGQQREELWTPVALALNEQPVYDSIQRNVGLFHIENFTETGTKKMLDDGVIYLTRLLEEAEDEIQLRPLWSINEDFKVFYKEMRELMLYIQACHTSKELQPYAEEGLRELVALHKRLQFSDVIYEKLLVEGMPEKPHAVIIHTKCILAYEKLGLTTIEPEQLPDLLEHYNLIQQLVEELETDGLWQVLSSSSREDLNKQRSVISQCDSIQSISKYEQRKTEFLQYYSYNSTKENVLLSLFKARSKLADMLGFSCYCEKKLTDTPFDTLEEVEVFINTISKGIKDFALQDFETMAAIKNVLDKNPLCFFDIPYLTQYAKMRICNEVEEEYTKYLTLGACIEGINKIFEKTFFITFDMSLALVEEVVSPDIYKLQVIHTCHGVICYLFLDLMKREDKPRKTAYYILREGKFEEDPKEYLAKTKWRPIRVVLSMSLERSGFPAYLTIDEAESFFMEIGKLLPQFLVHSRYQYALRYHSCIDFNLIFSYIVKKLFYDSRVMRGIYKRFPEGDHISCRNAMKISLSRAVFAPSQIQILVLKSAIDYECHTNISSAINLQEVFKDQEDKHFGLPMVENTSFHLKEKYLFDEKTSGKFYNELLLRAAVIRVWKRFYDQDPLDSESSDAFCELMHDCLHITDPKECFAKLMDMEITPENIAAVIINDVKENFEEVMDELSKLEI